MLNLQQIERLIEANQYPHLIQRILANGREVDERVHRALLCPAIVAPAALGLALQRACELSYGPTDVVERIVARLLDLQHANGRFGSDRFTPRATGDAIIATAIALRGLLDYQHQLAFFRPLSLRSPGRAAVRGVSGKGGAVASSRQTQSSVLNPQQSNQGLAAAVERTVGALAAAVAEHAAEREDSKRCSLPLDIARFHLQQHRTIAARINLPPARAPRRPDRSSCHGSWTQGMAA
jgi:hypothetical protein